MLSLVWRRLRDYVGMPLRTDARLVVEFDAEWVRVRALVRGHAPWNQECRWADITRVCFRDAGPWQSDLLYLRVRGRADEVEIPVEARGGDALWRELGARGLFPQPVMGQAMRAVDGGVYCWPPREPAAELGR